MTIKRKSLVAIVLATQITCVSAATSPPPLIIFAAGSTKGAIADIAQRYTAETGQPVRIINGSAGLLRERIEKGEEADVFVSANMAHPQRLASEGKATAPVVLARNSLCVQMLPGSDITSTNLLDRLLAPAVRIGTSTPGADPGGDYAWAFFAKADTVRPGAKAILEAKAQKLVGGPVAPAIPGNGNAVAYFLEHDVVDVFFGYCSSPDAKPDPSTRKVEVPADLAGPIDYGMSVVLRDKDPVRLNSAYQFARFALTPEAQARLPVYGFHPATDPAQ